MAKSSLPAKSPTMSTVRGLKEARQALSNERLASFHRTPSIVIFNQMRDHVYEYDLNQ